MVWSPSVGALELSFMVASFVNRRGDRRCRGAPSGTAERKGQIPEDEMLQLSYCRKQFSHRRSAAPGARPTESNAARRDKQERREL